MKHKILMTVLSILFVLVAGNTQTDTLSSFEWDKSTSINPYEEPSDVVFDFTKVQERYREVLEAMDNLSSEYNAKILIANEKLENSSEGNALKTYIKNLKKEKKSLQRDKDAFAKIYNQHGVSIKLHKANKKYAKKYLESLDVEQDSNQNTTSNTDDLPIELDKVDFADYQENIDKSYQSFPSFPCEILFNGVDQSAMQERKQLVSFPIFHYTHKNLKSYYKTQSFLEGAASLMELGNYTFVTFKITIKSKDASRNYGKIEEGSLMRIKTLNGALLYLPAFSTSNVSMDKETGYTEYYVAFMIDKDNKRDLKKYDIDKIGIMWTSGFEEYEVYAVDLIKEQLKCLQKI